VHIKVEDSTSGENTDGEGGGEQGEEATGGQGDEEEEGEEEEEEEEEEAEAEEEGQQRGQHAQAPGASFEIRIEAGADAVAPPRRARPPPGSYAATGVEMDTEAHNEEEQQEEEEEEWGEEEVEEEEEKEEATEPRDQLAVVPGASLTKCGSVAFRIQSLTKRARSEPGFPRARLRALARVANNDVQDNDAQLQPEEEVGLALVHKTHGGGGQAGTSRFKGVSWYTIGNKWKAYCRGKHLGYHTTQEAAARACSKYLKDGVAPEPAGPGPAGSSRFKGVSWYKRSNKWRAVCKGTDIGYYATEEDAARACSKYLEDGIDPVKHRDAITSQFTGVSWDKGKNKWRAECQGKYLGRHTTEQGAAQACSVEAERLGFSLNAIRPAGAAGAGAGPGAGAGGRAGSKRAAPKTPAIPASSKKPKRAS
jgi:hypothetical protein